MAASGHKHEASIRSFSKTDICTKKMSETPTTRWEVISEVLSVMNSYQSPSVLTLLPQEKKNLYTALVRILRRISILLTVMLSNIE